MLKQKAGGLAKAFLAAFFSLIVIFPSAASAQQTTIQQLLTPFYDPSSPTASDCSESSLVGSDHETQTWNFFKAQGLSDKQTAGIMGNMQQESSFNPLLMQIGGESKDPYDAGTQGWGLIQWSGNSEPTGDKVTRLYKASGLAGPIYELSTQLNLVWGHMNNNPPITKGDFNLDDFKNITDEKQAALYFLDHIEAGTDPGSVRENNATDILEKYGGTGTAGTGDGSDFCGGSVSTTSGNCSVSSIVYAPEYSQAQLARIFGDPGTASSHPAMQANLKSVNFMGHSVQANKAIADCLEAVAADIKNNGITYPITDVGCYRFDSDNGSSNIGLKSYHTYGAACDINPSTNNYYNTGNNGTRPYNPNCPPASGAVNSGNCYDMPPKIVQIFAAHGFYWGGNFTSIKDYMHFEWHGIIPQ
jgi:hypothetical protein